MDNKLPFLTVLLIKSKVPSVGMSCYLKFAIIIIKIGMLIMYVFISKIIKIYLHLVQLLLYPLRDWPIYSDRPI